MVAKMGIVYKDGYCDSCKDGYGHNCKDGYSHGVRCRAFYDKAPFDASVYSSTTQETYCLQKTSYLPKNVYFILCFLLY